MPRASPFFPLQFFRWPMFFSLCLQTNYLSSVSDELFELRFQNPPLGPGRKFFTLHSSLFTSILPSLKNTTNLAIFFDLCKYFHLSKRFFTPSSALLGVTPKYLRFSLTISSIFRTFVASIKTLKAMSQKSNPSTILSGAPSVSLSSSPPPLGEAGRGHPFRKVGGCL